MRLTRILILLLFTASVCHGDDHALKVSGSFQGKKVQFPAKGLVEGVKATIDLVKTCCENSTSSPEALRKAEQGDHIRLVFAKPLTVEVMNETVEVSELILKLPMGDHVF